MNGVLYMSNLYFEKQEFLRGTIKFLESFKDLKVGNSTERLKRE